MGSDVPIVTSFAPPEMLSNVTSGVTTKITQINSWPLHIDHFFHSPPFSVSDLDTLVKSLMTKNAGGLWQCTQCNYSSKKSSHVQNHVEAKHVQTEGHYCPICSKFCATRNGLMIHKSRFHQQSLQF